MVNFVAYILIIGGKTYDKFLKLTLSPRRPMNFRPHSISASLLICFLIVAGCKKEDEKPPIGIMDKKELAAFLVDVYLAEAQLDSRPISKDSAMKLFIPHEEKLLEKWGLKDSTLKVTYQYYMNHPKDMELVFDSVIDTLSLREQQIK